MPKKTSSEETKITKPVSSKAKKTKETAEPDNAKVLKANELGNWWFLSGLWFNQKIIEIKKDYDDEDDSIIQKKPIEVIKSVKEPEIIKQQIPKNDFLTNVMSGKEPEHIAPKQIIVTWYRDSKKPEVRKATPQQTKPQTSTTNPNQNTSHKWPDLAFFDGIKRYEQPKRPTNSKPGNIQISNNNRSNNRPSNQYIAKPVQAKIERVEKIATTSANLVKKIEITIDEKITVKEFSEKMGIPLPMVMKKLMENKIMTSITASLDFDTASLIAEDLWVIVNRKENKLNLESFMTWDLQSILALDKDVANTETRPPIVTIMGHVDHGKTSLLDYFRKTGVADWEAWWITQSIWASVVEYHHKKICFIDTPGHELFTSLRARWAKLTNIAVIVVAADDSVMPQTVESIWHAKAAWVPIIIAITKIDKAGKNIEQIKQDLAKYEIIPEDWWWDVPIVGVSSKTGQGIDELLETILLQTEMLDLKFDPNRAAAWVILDANKDPKQWVVSSIIIMTGTLKVWDIIVAYNTYGKVRRMKNWKWENVTQAVGGEPVQILWITDLPEPGRILEVVATEKIAQQKIAMIAEEIKRTGTESIVQQFISGLKSWVKETELRLILKADGSSSLEALKQAMAGIKLPKNVVIKIVHTDVGHFSEADLSLAQASSALLIWFNISLNAILKKKAENLKIEMRSFDIIYELTDYIDKLVFGLIEIEMHEVAIWKLEILWIFYAKWKEMVVWWKIIEWKVKNKLKFRIIRWEEIFASGEIKSLQKNRDEVKEMNEWEECGMKVHVSKKVEIWDIFEFLEMQEIKD